MAVPRAAQPAHSEAPPAPEHNAGSGGTLLCTSVTANTLAGALAEIAEAKQRGATAIELRLDFLEEFDPEVQLPQLMSACGDTPYIVTYRPTWEGCAALRMLSAAGGTHILRQLRCLPPLSCRWKQ